MPTATRAERLRFVRDLQVRFMAFYVPFAIAFLVAGPPAALKGTIGRDDETLHGQLES